MILEINTGSDKGQNVDYQDMIRHICGTTFVAGAEEWLYMVTPKGIMFMGNSHRQVEYISPGCVFVNVKFVDINIKIVRNR